MDDPASSSKSIPALAAIPDPQVSAKKPKEIPVGELKKDSKRWKQACDAVQTEWGKWLSMHAINILTPEQAKEFWDRALTSRPVFTDKNQHLRNVDPKILEKLKCRVVTHGFKERGSHLFRKDAPTIAAVGQNVVLTVAARSNYACCSADARNAYFQGRKMSREVYVRFPTSIPLPRGVAPGSLMLAQHGLYGVTDAGRLFFLELRDNLLALGFKQSKFDPGLFYLPNPDGGLPLSAIAVHVDNLLMAWDTSHPASLAAQEEWRKRIIFGSWDVAERGGPGFRYCGRNIRRETNGGIVVDMKDYPSSITPARISRERRAQRGSKLTDIGTQKLQGIIGQVLWLARMLVVDLAFRVSELSGEISNPTVETLIEANSLARACKHFEKREMRFWGDESGFFWEKADIIVCTDASWPTMKNFKSQPGVVVLLADPELLNQKGTKESARKLYRVIPMEWKSARIKRVCRSSLAGELYALGSGSGNGFWLRQLFAEILGKNPGDDKEVGASRRISWVIDAKAAFGNLSLEKANLEDRRAALEVALLRDDLHDPESGVSLNWVPTGQQLSDGLTKRASPEVGIYMDKVFSFGMWTLSPDPRVPVDKRGRVLVDEFNKLLETKDQWFSAVSGEVLCFVFVQMVLRYSDDKRPSPLDEDGMDLNEGDDTKSDLVPEPRMGPSIWLSQKVMRFLRALKVYLFQTWASSVAAMINAMFPARRKVIGALSATQNKKIAAEEASKERALKRIADIEAKQKARADAKSKSKAKAKPKAQSANRASSPIRMVGRATSDILNEIASKASTFEFIKDGRSECKMRHEVRQLFPEFIICQLCLKELHEDFKAKESSSSSSGL